MTRRGTPEPPAPTTVNNDKSNTWNTRNYYNGNDLAWVRRISTVDAVDAAQVETLLAEGSWALLHVGIGKGGQTTLTFGWPRKQAKS